MSERTERIDWAVDLAVEYLDKAQEATSWSSESGWGQMAQNCATVALALLEQERLKNPPTIYTGPRMIR